MNPGFPQESVKWLHRPHWLIIGGSIIAAVVALAAEGPGSFIGLGLLAICVAVICSWTLTSKPSLEWSVVIVAVAMVTLGWTVEEPESALFQSVLVTAAVGWRIDQVATSVGLLVLMALVPFIATLGPYAADWGWWNWTVGTLFTWTMGRLIRLLEITLGELTDARSRLIEVAANEERRRISRDVHDLVGHSLTAMLLNIRAAQRSLSSDPLESSRALFDAESIGTAGIADIRAAMIELRNNAKSGNLQETELESLPDGESIRRLLERQDHINISSSGPIGELHGPTAVALHRILQECITNITKHAPAGTAIIRLESHADQIDLVAENPLPAGASRRDALSENTLGLISMRERVNSLGGTFNAGATMGVWRVSCRIPRSG